MPHSVASDLGLHCLTIHSMKRSLGLCGLNNISESLSKIQYELIKVTHADSKKITITDVCSLQSMRSHFTSHYDDKQG